MQVKHFVIKHSGDKYSVDGEGFTSLLDLVAHHKKVSMAKVSRDACDASRVAVVQGTSVFLKREVKRKAWQLDHCDITVTKKLGEGAFGEVSA